MPPAWVSNRDLLERASLLFEQLDLRYQELLNNVLWDAEIFTECSVPVAVWTLAKAVISPVLKAVLAVRLVIGLCCH